MGFKPGDCVVLNGNVDSLNFKDTPAIIVATRKFNKYVIYSYVVVIKKKDLPARYAAMLHSGMVGSDLDSYSSEFWDIQRRLIRSDIAEVYGAYNVYEKTVSFKIIPYDPSQQPDTEEDL